MITGEIKNKIDKIWTDMECHWVKLIGYGGKVYAIAIQS